MTPSSYAARLAHVRRQAHIRRASACALVPERVLLMPLRPLTPATWSLLVGTDSAFVSGAPAIAADVRNFVLFHSPRFDPDFPRASAWVRFRAHWALERALVPGRARLRSDARAGVRALRLQQAIAEIRAIVDDTFADVPMPEERAACEPPRLAASLEAQFLDLFAARYPAWPLPQPIRHTPIRILTQLARCIDRAPYFDRGEARLDAAYLAELNPPSSQLSALSA